MRCAWICSCETAGMGLPSSGGVDAFAEYVDWCLARKSWTSKECAFAAGLRRSTIDRWRDGRDIPNIPNARAFARAIGVPLVEVLIQAGHLAATEVRVWVQHQQDIPDALPPLENEVRS